MIRWLVLCDGATQPPGSRADAFDHTVTLARQGMRANLKLSIETPAHALLTAVAGRTADLVRIAAFVYGADQAIARSGDVDVFGDQWVRQITLCMPVSEPDFWNSPTVLAALQGVLRFASGDRWSFRFAAPARREMGSDQLSFQLRPESTLGEPDCLYLFSGGLDSLSAVVAATHLHGRRPVLVSHAPRGSIALRQRFALTELRKAAGVDWAFPDVTFDIHRIDDPNPAEVTQRTRPFLFAALGTVVAYRLGLREVALADNGVVSLNLPINDQLIGTTASRSTHPKVLRRFNEFARLVFEDAPTVVNPLWSSTRSEGLQTLKQTGLSRLVAATNSCSKGRSLRVGCSHCGTCSQCVDRRFATMATGLAEFDPGSQYAVNIFADPLPGGRARAMVLSYVRFALEVEKLDRDAVFRRFPQLLDVADPHSVDRGDVRAAIAALLQRHSRMVLSVLADEMARHRHELVRPDLNEPLLLRLVAGPSGNIDRPRLGQAADAAVQAAHALAQPPRYLFKRNRDTWTVVFDGQPIPIGDRKGLHYLQVLLRHPERRFSGLELQQAWNAPAPTTGVSLGVSADELQQQGLSRDPGTRGLASSDMQALAEYRQMLKDSDEEIAEAEANNNFELAAQYRSQKAELLDHIGKIVGRGGRIRETGSSTSKARDTVAKAIASAIKRIAQDSEELANHLQRNVDHSDGFTYRPEPPLPWSFNGGAD